MRRFLLALLIVSACLGTTFLGTRDTQAQEVAQKIDFAKLQRQAEQGDARAQYMLGLLFSAGEGVPQDYAKAIKWKEKAATQGLVDAQINLAGIYAEGRGVPQNHEQEAKWLRFAAAQGDAGAQFRLGALYANGLGVPQDYVQAHKWVNLAAAQGNKDAADLRSDLEKEMTPNQIAEAQRLAQEENLSIKFSGIPFDDLTSPSETAKDRAESNDIVPLPLEQEKKTGGWKDIVPPSGLVTPN